MDKLTLRKKGVGLADISHFLMGLYMRGIVSMDSKADSEDKFLAKRRKWRHKTPKIIILASGKKG